MTKIFLRYLFIFISILMPVLLNGQTLITGSVMDSNKKPVSDVNIFIYEKGSSVILDYSMTNTSGTYKIQYKGVGDSIKIGIAGFNIKRQFKVVRNSPQVVNFTTMEEAIQLNEVKIAPKKIRKVGDTLIYNVESFTDKNDRTIGDVLKNMPGIEVKENGAILYQDRPINKFYIEGLDLLQGRYGVATNSLEAKNVSSVHVMENHQPIKALKDKSFSEDAAINLKLKESAKGVIMANAQLGVGVSPLLWDNELNVMYISKQLQNVSVYKGNNSGNNISSQFAEQYSNSGNINIGGLMNVQTPMTPNIRSSRYLNNISNAASLNNIKLLKDDYQLTTNVNYINDFREKNSYSVSDYYLSEDSTLNIEEQLSSRLRKEHLLADIKLNANSSKYYLDNVLKLGGVWDREKGDAIIGDSVSQSLSMPNYGILNNFKFIKTLENKLWTVSSDNGYSSTDQSLSITPVLYPDLFNPMHSTMVQDIDRREFSSSNKIKLDLGKGVFKQNYAFDFKADIRNLKSGLHTEANNFIPDSLRNNIQYNTYKWEITPGYIVHKNKLNASLMLPLSYSLLTNSNKVNNVSEDKSFLYFNPRMNINYKLTPFWTANLNYYFNNSIGGITNAYTNYIMSSYRSLQRNDGSLYKTRSQNASLLLQYRNVFTTLFITGNISYFNRRANLLYNNYYQGILNVQSSVYIPNTTEGWTFYGTIKKNIDAINTIAFLDGSYTSNKSSQINQDLLLKYTNQSYSISPRINTKVGEFISFSYKFSYAQNRNKIEGSNNEFKPITKLSHDAQLNIFPIKGVAINFKYENTYNNAIELGNRSMSFGDVSVRYKHSRVELTLDYTNVFNTKRFISAQYGDISRYYYSYDLRPAQILLRARFKLK